MKKIFAVCTVLVMLFTGCGADITSYPWAAAAQPAQPPAAALTVTVPGRADDTLTNTLVVLEAKLGELSTGAVTLDTKKSDDIVTAYRQGGAGLYLLSSQEMAQLDDRLEFASMPFLFANSQQMLSLIGNTQGAVRGSAVTKKRLSGEILGIYYNDTRWIISKGTFYEELGFYNSMGVLTGSAGNGCFGVLGSETVTQASQEELFALFNEGKLRYCEITPGVQLDETTRANIKSLELTYHRYDGWWMVLKNPDNAMDGTLVNVIKEAYAYTHEQQNSLREGQEAENLGRLEVDYALPVREDTQYTQIHKLAQKYYQENGAALGIPEEIMWALGLVQQGPRG